MGCVVKCKPNVSDEVVKESEDETGDKGFACAELLAVGIDLDAFPEAGDGFLVLLESELAVEALREGHDIATGFRFECRSNESTESNDGVADGGVGKAFFQSYIFPEERFVCLKENGHLVNEMLKVMSFLWR